MMRKESGEISMDEFVAGCMQLEGPAKSLHLARMRHGGPNGHFCSPSYY